MLIPLGFLAASGSAAGSFDLLETTVLTGSQASVEFTNLTTKYASTYQHLQIRATVRDTDNTFDTARLGLRLNGDTSANYSFHGLFSRGSSVTTYANAGESIIRISQDTPTDGKVTSNVYAGIVIDLLDPFETSKFKTVRSLSGFAAGDSLIALQSGSWRSTNSTTSLTLLSLEGVQLKTGSRFSLYGLKAA